MANVLIVDDEPDFASGIADYLRLHKHTAVSVNTISSARDALSARFPEVLLLDLMLPDGNGLELFDEFEKKRPRKIVIITGNSGIKSLIGGVAGDGVSYLKKPIEPRTLLSLIDAEADIPFDETHNESAHFGTLVGESEVMQELYQKIRQVAETDSTVFIQGESGTGKELVADAIHRLSKRSGKYVPVNCGGLTRDLVSSQLFGHEKGSFTGANKQHQGFFERADDGTLFLDEITEMPLEMQAHLLRVLETGKVLRVGAETEIPVSARLIAATNREPIEAVREGNLREDLYFRLGVFPIVLPPLRDRIGDIELLAQHFLSEFNKKNNTNHTISTDAIQSMMKHSWPGNVRELMHMVNRACIEADDGVIQPPAH